MSDLADTPWTCRDERTIAAPIERCFAALADLATYPLWWTLVAVTSLDGATRVAAGGRLRFAGARPGGSEVTWTAAVREVDAPRRIALAYDGGSLIGDTAWELAPAAAGTSVAYCYLGVRANEEQSRASFARFGIGLHKLAMQHDALAGLERYLVHGATVDDAWRADVHARIAAGLRAAGG